MPGSRAVRLLALSLTVVMAVPVGANRESDALRARAFDLAYNLDHEQALAAFHRAIEADPTDAAAYRGLATIIWLNITFRRGAATVDDYLGQVTKGTVSRNPAPPDQATAFQQNVTLALALAEKRVRGDDRNVDAHYQVGAAVGLMASYAATVDGKVLGAFRSARRAFDEHERVLELAPARKDAGLIVGIYRYAVAALSLPLRLMAYAAGFGGDKARGLRMIEDAARYPGDTQTDAKFALILLYNREGRYDEARRIIAELQQQFPRNRLLWLEEGATALRAGRAADAKAALDRGIAMLERDARPKMFGEEALWRYKRGAAQMMLRRYPDAEQDLRSALGRESRMWVQGRVHAELGRLAQAKGDRALARSHYQTAIKLGQNDGDVIGTEAAGRLLNSLK